MSDTVCFLQESELLYANNWLRLPADALLTLQAAAAKVEADPKWRNLANEGREILFPAAGTVESRGSTDPSDWVSRLGEMTALIIPLVLISGVRQLKELYKLRDIPEKVLIDTLSDLKLWMEEYYRKHGTWGTDILWLHNHLNFHLFRLGRLQFCRSRWNGHMVVLRHKETRETIVLAEAGLRFRSDGLLDGTSGRYDAEGVWLSELVINDSLIQGHLISPEGYAHQEQLTISQSTDWEMVLRDGDAVLDIHIAADGKLDPAACNDSVRDAEQFFSRYFAEENFCAYVCNSWLLDSQFKHLLAPSSNIVRFLDGSFMLYPVPSSGKAGLERIFDWRLYTDWSEAPQDTTLRRIIRGHMMNGNELRDMGGFMLRGEAAWR
ncbi:acyltransferase domain-containing protein [Paenibacillus sp. OV219]|uniref:acyltransferase domain-containing protein n=1 Tax=Paenibacillus sp. OV219 TaxID=1884377 RepID=UPI0008BC9DFC|nr:acyltransferase domain-containing protein [Paenibacillus sp. OV219]SEO33580.1 hypothetical protein SAMN05518847_107127 [Paenibacillus sp. OV219]